MEPPSAMTTVMAFSNASLVMIWRAVMPWRSRFTTASATLAMVLAVYMPPQEPWPGQAAFSIASRSSRLISPRAQAPTPSKTSMIVRSSRSPSLPGSVEPE